MIALDLAGVAVSSGSACSSGKVAPSHVLAAMGVAAGVCARRDPRSASDGARPSRDVDALRRGLRGRDAAHARRYGERRPAAADANLASEAGKV